MFRIVCFCEDKKLGDVLQALKGLIHPNPSATPVANAEFSNGQVKAVTDGTMPVMFMRYVRQHKLKEVDASIARGFLRTTNWNESSSTHCLKECVEAGYLRKTGTGAATKYIVKPVK